VLDAKFGCRRYFPSRLDSGDIAAGEVPGLGNSVEYRWQQSCAVAMVRMGGSALGVQVAPSAARPKRSKVGRNRSGVAMMFGAGKQKALVGLDIGSSSIKEVELKSTKQGYELVSYALESLAQDTVVDGAIMDAPLVAGAISQIFETQSVKTKNVATSVSGHSVIVKRVTLPMMTEEELYDRIQSEASQHIPFDIADVNLDYQLLDSIEGQMDVLLVAVKKDKILNHTNVLAQAGKNSMIVDIDAFALQNCFEVNYDPDPGQTIALLNVGASVMNINIIHGGFPLFTRDVSVGGNQYTDALQKELDLSFEDAERLKKGEAIAGVAEEHRATILRSVTDVLILEIQKTFDFFRATASGASIQRIVVAGGSARVPGLSDVLKDEFAVPVEEMYPFRKIVINPSKHNEEQIRTLAPRLSIAVGLALRSFDEQ
jgi:type IV pilus assembly protein PilM